MSWLRFLLAASALLVVTAAGARAPERRIAVLEFRWVEQRDVGLLGKLADQARSAAVEVAKPRGYLVMTRENTVSLLSDMGQSGVCAEGECEVETARAIGADLVVSGEIVPIKGRLFATLKLHESKGGSLLSTADLEAGDELELVRNLRAAATSLLEKGIGRPAPPPQRAVAEIPDPWSRQATSAASDLPRGPYPGAPAPPPPPATGGYGAGAEVLVAYDEAVHADQAGEPRAAIGAWARLARMPDPNPYRQVSEERLAWWQQNERAVEARNAACVSGLDTMMRVMPLTTVPADQKSSMMREFASAHGTPCVARLLPVLSRADRALACRALPGEILAALIAVCSED